MLLPRTLGANAIRPPSLPILYGFRQLTAELKGGRPKRKVIGDWVSKNDDSVRRLPIYVGGMSLLGVLFNRIAFIIAPVADATRAWESLSTVTCCRSLVIVYNAICFLQIGYASASSTDETMAVDTIKLMRGSIYQGVIKSGSRITYFSSLGLTIAIRFSLISYMKGKAVILQPIGDKGNAIPGGGIIRGFTTSD